MNNFYFKLSRSRKFNIGLKEGVWRPKVLMYSPKQGRKSRKRTPESQISKKRVARGMPGWQPSVAAWRDPDCSSLEMSARKRGLLGKMELIDYLTWLLIWEKRIMTDQMDKWRKIKIRQKENHVSQTQLQTLNTCWVLFKCFNLYTFINPLHLKRKKLKYREKSLA